MLARIGRSGESDACFGAAATGPGPLPAGTRRWSRRTCARYAVIAGRKSPVIGRAPVGPSGAALEGRSCRRVPTGAGSCRAVPEHPSEHGASTDADRSRPFPSEPSAGSRRSRLQALAWAPVCRQRCVAARPGGITGVGRPRGRLGTARRHRPLRRSSGRAAALLLPGLRSPVAGRPAGGSCPSPCHMYSP
jgi:hypothetical protein